MVECGMKVGFGGEEGGGLWSYVKWISKLIGERKTNVLIVGRGTKTTPYNHVLTTVDQTNMASTK